MADTSNSVLFDAPGPKGRRTIRIVNWIAGILFAVVLVLILMRLHNPPDGENQLSWELWKPAVEREAWTDFYLPGLWMTIKATIVAVVGAVVFGLVFGVAGVMGLLVGGLSSGFVLAVFMANSGGAWDNAKKLIEEGNFGGKGSECHKATVVGDTVGDPFKDTSGPSLNILIKLMSMVSIVMAGLTVAWHLF